MSQPVLAEVAEAIGLASAVRVAPGEAKAGVRQRATVLADALEAALGALYLDGGLEPARAFVRRAWNGAMIRQDDAAARTPRPALQEWVQARGLAAAGLRRGLARGAAACAGFVVTVAAGGVTGTGDGGQQAGGGAGGRRSELLARTAGQPGEARGAASSPSSGRRTRASPRCSTG